MRTIINPARLALACLSTWTSYAATSNEVAKPTSKWTTEDVLQTEWGANFKISPDCRKVVWVKAVPDKEKNSHIGNLMLSDLTGTNEIQLTRGADGSGDPKWSPDGQLIGFLSSRPDPAAKPDDSDSKGKDRIWLINPFGGEAWPLTDGKRAVKRFEWAGATTIVYAGLRL